MVYIGQNCIKINNHDVKKNKWYYNSGISQSSNGNPVPLHCADPVCGVGSKKVTAPPWQSGV